MTTTARRIVARCAAAIALMTCVCAAPAAAQERDKPAMPGMRMPAPSPTRKPSPTPTPTPKPSPMQMPMPVASPSPSPSPTPLPSPSPQTTPAGMEGMEMPQTKPSPSRGKAANPQAAPQTGSPADAQRTTTLPNLSDRSRWPSPTADDATYTFMLFDLLEYQRAGSVNALRWDFLGWRGGDHNRVWFKSEGALNFESPLGGQADLQLLYGRHITPFFDLQIGGRIEQRYERTSQPARVFAVIGLQGMSPGRFEVEPALFLSNKGKVSGRFTGTWDLYQTQRWIWQPRLETEFAAQRDAGFGVERGLNDVEIGVRLRYEIRREFAPYFGVTYSRSFGATRERIRREGGDPGEVLFSVGVRMWR